MKTLINSILIIVFLGITALNAQVAPPDPPTPPGSESAPPPPPPPQASDVDHDGNYKITMKTSDSKSGESINLTLKNNSDRYLANGRFPKRFRSDIVKYITDEMGQKRVSSKNFDQWVGGAEEDAVYKITLKEKSVVISLDKSIASSTLTNKIGDLGVGIKNILSEEDMEQEVERLERDADRLRRDADRMRLEAERIRAQAQRDLDRAERDAARAERDADRLFARVERDAERVTREAALLTEEADRAGNLAAHKGGMDRVVRDVLRLPSTMYDTNIAQNSNGWTWPAFQQDLILSLEGDDLVGEDNELVVISDQSGIYVNGTKMTSSQEISYRDLFRKHGFASPAYFTFYKLYNHIAFVNQFAQVQEFFEELMNKNIISSLNKPVLFEVNGNSLKRDGETLENAELRKMNLLLAKHNITPVPGKIVAIDKKGSFIAGYRPESNTILGTWVLN